jgi:ribosomal protein S18 acetylase RimI-like enzyme
MELHHTLRPLQTGDLPGVAEVHLAAFPGSALTLLGKEAVRRYYEWQLTGPHQVTALGVFTENSLSGFCFGGRFQGSLVGFLRRNWGFLLWQTVTHFWLLADPAFRGRAGLGVNLLKRFTRPRSRPEAALAALPVRSFGILSIAVHPHRQGKGFGRLLMDSAEQTALQCGFSIMHLTVETHNRQAITFYESLGWEKIPGDHTWNGKMKKDL